MSTGRFDDLARTLATPMPRSRALKTLGAGLAVAMFPALRPTRATGAGSVTCPIKCDSRTFACCTATKFPGGAPGIHVGGCCDRKRERCCIGPNAIGNPMSWCCPTCKGELCGDGCCEKGQFCASPRRSLCCGKGEDACVVSGGGKGQGQCCKPDERCCFNTKSASCCKPNQTCKDGKCLCLKGEVKCPGGQCCANGKTCCGDEGCCEKGEVCYKGVCCPKGKHCSTVCCKDGERCSNGICCPKGNEECNGRCCAKGKCCGDTCCGENEFCSSTIAYPKPRVCCTSNRIIVAPSGAPVCCPSGTVPNEADTGCCPSGNPNCCGELSCLGNSMCVRGTCQKVS